MFKNRRPERWGLIQLFTGNGKGKTTAALGTALRAIATGKRVAIVYFDKGGTHYSERRLLALLNDPPLKLRGVEGVMSIDVVATGLDRIDPKTGRFRFGVTDEDKREGAKGLSVARDFVASGRYDLVVLDEVNTAVSLGIIPHEPVLNLLHKKPAHVEMILTGRNAPPELIEAADLVTEMKLVKHYFYHGEPAREGLDY